MKKLSNRRGASVIIALVVFMLAALSGTIVLTMASSNAGRYTHSKEEQQAYLAVASAAKLVKDELKDFSVTVKFELDSKNKTLNCLKEYSGSKFLQSIDAISKGCEYCTANYKIPDSNTWLGSTGYTPPSSPSTSTGNLQLNQAESDMGAVEVKVTADSAANLTFEFKYKGGSNISYGCKMTFCTPQIKPDTNGDNGILTVTCVYTWNTENVPVEAA